MGSRSQRLSGAVCCCVIALAGCTSSGPTAASTPAPPTSPTPPITTTPITVTAKAKFAYTGNQGASLSGFLVDTSTGALAALSGFPLAIIGANPVVVAIDPQNRFLFVGDGARFQLHVFAIDSSTGALSEIGTSPYAINEEPIAIAVDPSGTHVYVEDAKTNSVGGFSVSATGALTPIAGSPFPVTGAQNFGRDVVINASGTFAYAQDLDDIYTYSVNASSGALTLTQTIAGPSGGFAIALDPHGTYLYAVGDPNAILAYSIDATTGLLTPAPSSPMVEQNGAYTISISPTGQFAYTIENNNYLVSYAFNNGVFKPVGSVYAQVYGLEIGIDPSGSFVYVPQACDTCPSSVSNVVHEFSIGSTGALTKISGSPVAAGTTPYGIAFTTQ